MKYIRTSETYEATLPCRVLGDTGIKEVLQLYKFPHWADQTAVTTMAEDLESNRRKLEGSRSYVRYATAPTACGKTSSILPAFLNSAELKRIHRTTPERTSLSLITSILHSPTTMIETIVHEGECQMIMLKTKVRLHFMLRCLQEFF